MKTFASVLRAGVTVALNFVRERTPESCTRLCALLCCVTGCTCAVGTVRFAFANPAQATTVASLVGETSALIAAGCVALLSRTRKNAFGSHSEQREESAVAVGVQ